MAYPSVVVSSFSIVSLLRPRIVLFLLPFVLHVEILKVSLQENSPKICYGIQTIVLFGDNAVFYQIMRIFINACWNRHI